jgi:tripartite-type tricarboxylate transporter receptor subunit TctC
MMRLASALAAMVLSAAPLQAEEYAPKEVKLIVNFGAGGTTDTAARVIAQAAAERLGIEIAAMNKPGAGGTLGVAELAQAESDGSVIGTVNMPAISIIPQMRSVPYDPEADLVQIAGVMPYEYAVFVKGDSPWKTWEDLVEAAKASPGEITVGQVGTGTTNHLAMTRIGADLGIDWVDVPFQSGVEATTALLGGHVDVINNTIASVVPSLRSGDIRALLITSEDRFSLTPDVPTMQEKGFDFAQISWMSIAAPAGISDERRAALEAAFKAAVEDPAVLEKTGELDLHPRFKSGADYEALLARMAEEWSPILEEMGLKAK